MGKLGFLLLVVSSVACGGGGPNPPADNGDTDTNTTDTDSGDTDASPTDDAPAGCVVTFSGGLSASFPCHSFAEANPGTVTLGVAGTSNGSPTFNFSMSVTTDSSGDPSFVHIGTYPSGSADYTTSVTATAGTDNTQWQESSGFGANDQGSMSITITDTGSEANEGGGQYSWTSLHGSFEGDLGALKGSSTAGGLEVSGTF